MNGFSGPRRPPRARGRGGGGGPGGAVLPGERLPGPPRLVAIEQRKKLRAAVAAADADQAGDRRIPPRGPNRGCTKLRGARHIAAAGKDRVVEHRDESQPSDLFDAEVEL